MLWVFICYMVRYATRIFIAKIIFVSLIRFGPFNTMVPFTFITMAFGFDQHPNSLKGLIFLFLGEIRFLVLWLAKGLLLMICRCSPSMISKCLIRWLYPSLSIISETVSAMYLLMLSRYFTLLSGKVMTSSCMVFSLAEATADKSAVGLAEQGTLSFLRRSNFCLNFPPF